MTLDEIREEVKKTEDIVYAAISDFKEKTGLSIVSCEMSVTTMYPFGPRRKPRVIVGGVDLGVEPL